MEGKNWVAIDRRGIYTHPIAFTSRRPRAGLLKVLGHRSARPFFCDTKDGQTFRTGWIVGGAWFEVFEVSAHPVRKLLAIFALVTLWGSIVTGCGRTPTEPPAYAPCPNCAPFQGPGTVPTLPNLNPTPTRTPGHERVTP